MASPLDMGGGGDFKGATTSAHRRALLEPTSTLHGHQKAQTTGNPAEHAAHHRQVSLGDSAPPGPCAAFPQGGGGVTRARSLTPTPPPSLEIGRKVPDHQRQRCRKQFCLMWQRVKKNVFSPHVSILNIVGIFRRIQKNTTKLALFS